MARDFTPSVDCTNQARLPIPLQQVTSNQIGAIGYCHDTKTLVASFKRGAGNVYEYPNVEPETGRARSSWPRALASTSVSTSPSCRAASSTPTRFPCLPEVRAMNFVNIHGQPVHVSITQAPRQKAVADTPSEFHKGFRVVGHPPPCGCRGQGKTRG